MTRDELIEALKKATGPSMTLDREIWENTGEKEREITRRFALPGETRAVMSADFFRPLPPRYTASIDAAVSLYATKPTMIPSGPIPNCIAALKARAND
jgi:hypothetical protein